jgi:DNA repair protein RadC
MAATPKHLPAVRVMLVREALPLRSAANPGDCVAIGRELIGDADREHLVALMLDLNLRVVATHTVGIGNVGTAPCDLAGLFRAVLLAGAAKFVLVHNHPGGTSIFSGDDRDLCARVVQIGRLLGVELADFIVVTPGQGPWSSLLLNGRAAERERDEAWRARRDEERTHRRAILCRSDAERAAFVAGVMGGAGPMDLVDGDGILPRALPFQDLTRRFYSATVPLPNPPRLALGLPDGATFARASRLLLKRWKAEGVPRATHP